MGVVTCEKVVAAKIHTLGSLAAVNGEGRREQLMDAGIYGLLWYINVSIPHCAVSKIHAGETNSSHRTGTQMKCYRNKFNHKVYTNNSRTVSTIE